MVSKQAIYMREYRKKQSVKDREKRYYQKNKEKLSIQVKEYEEDNKEKIAERKAKYYLKNKEKIDNINKEWQVNNKEQSREISRNYYKKNKKKILDRCKEYRKTEISKLSVKNSKHKRRTIEKNTNITTKWLKDLKDKSNKCILCDIELCDGNIKNNSRHLDHILPINVGGLHMKDNVRFICKKCNISRPHDGSDL